MTGSAWDLGEQVRSRPRADSDRLGRDRRALARERAHHRGRPDERRVLPGDRVLPLPAVAGAARRHRGVE